MKAHFSIATGGWIFFVGMSVLILLLAMRVRAAYIAAGESHARISEEATDVVTRLEMHPGETLRLAHPIGAMDVVCR